MEEKRLNLLVISEIQIKMRHNCIFMRWAKSKSGTIPSTGEDMEPQSSSTAGGGTNRRSDSGNRLALPSRAEHVQIP